MAEREKWLPKMPGYQNLGNILPPLTRPLYQGKQDRLAYLFSDWPMIVGEALAKCTWPLKVTYPRNKEAQGGILHLSVLSAHALEVQYRLDEICERIAIYFGGPFISSIRLVQKPLDEEERHEVDLQAERRKKARDIKQGVLQTYPDLATIPDQGLREALTDIGVNLELRECDLLPK